MKKKKCNLCNRRQSRFYLYRSRIMCFDCVMEYRALLEGDSYGIPYITLLETEDTKKTEEKDDSA